FESSSLPPRRSRFIRFQVENSYDLSIKRGLHLSHSESSLGRSVSMSAPDSARPSRSSPLVAVLQWIDSDYTSGGADKMRNEPDKVDWVRCIPFLILHAGCLGVIWVGASPIAVWTAIALYFLRMFAVTGGYH